MGKIADFFRRSSKTSQAGPVIYRSGKNYGVMNTQFSKREYSKFASEGFRKNVIAHRCISDIAAGVASIPWCLYDSAAPKKKLVDASKPQDNTETDSEETEIEDKNNSVLKLIKKANPTQTFAAVVETAVIYRLLAGDVFFEAVGPQFREPRELYALRPDRMTVIPGPFGLPGSYVYKIGENEKTFPANPVNGKGPILQWKKFHPFDDWRGMPPIEAAMMGVDQHNQAGVWNFSLLKNGARQSGTLSVKQNEDGSWPVFSPEQREMLKTEVAEKLQGVTHAGEVIIIDGGLDYKEMGLSPRDMDWIESKHTSARDIATAFGYPSILLGIPGDTTYSNYQEARLALWENTILPEAQALRDSLNLWLMPQFSDTYRLDLDLDQIPALYLRRQKLWDTIRVANYLTTNEKREMVGFGPVEGGDEILIPSATLPLDMVINPPDPPPVVVQDPNNPMPPKPLPRGGAIPPKPGTPARPGTPKRPASNPTQPRAGRPPKGLRIV